MPTTPNNPTINNKISTVKNQNQSNKFLCGGRDSNPRRPTPQDLKSCPFGQLGHPRLINFLKRYVVN